MKKDRGQKVEVRESGAEKASENGLPKGWVATSLEKCVSPNRTKALPSDSPKAAFIGLEHVEAHTMKILGHDIAGNMASSCFVFKAHDVLYSRLRPYLNKVAQPTFNGLCSSEFIVFPPNDLVDSSFLRYRLNALDFVRFANSLNAGDRPRVDFAQLSPFPILLPPLAVQRKIVAKIEELFSDLDEGVESLKKAQEQLKVYRQSVLKAAFEGKLTAEWRAKQKKLPTAQELLATIQAERQAHYETKLKEWKTATTKWEKGGKVGKKPSKPSAPEEMVPLTKDELKELPMLPEGWAWCKLGQAYQVNVGATPSRKDTAYWNGNIPWVSSGEVAFRPIHSTHESITEDGLSNASTQIQPVGSVMLAMIGEGKTRGQAAILKIGACHNQNTASINVFSQSSEYLYYYLYSQYEQTRRIGSGNNQKALNKSRIQNMAFPICSPVEQKHIGDYLELKDSEISNQNEIISFAISQAGTLRQSILKRAFEGKLL